MPGRDSSDITADVLSALARDPGVSVYELDVTTLGGHVTMSGVTASQDSRSAAEEIARGVDGVRGVVNAIVVNPEAYGLKTDADIRSDVERAFTLDPEVPPNQLHVDVRDGVVTLRGYLENGRERAAALEDVARIAGVKDVIDLTSVLLSPN